MTVIAQECEREIDHQSRRRHDHRSRELRGASRDWVDVDMPRICTAFDAYEKRSGARVEDYIRRGAGRTDWRCSLIQCNRVEGTSGGKTLIVIGFEACDACYGSAIQDADWIEAGVSK